MRFQTILFKSSVRCISFDMIIYLLVGFVYLFPNPFVDHDFGWILLFYLLYIILVCSIYVIEIIISVLLCTIEKINSFCLCAFPILDIFSLFVCQIFDGGDNYVSWEVYIMVLILYKIGSSIYKYRKYNTILSSGKHSALGI